MTIFSKIISGEIPSYKIHESDHFFAFLDISPLVVGHTLVVPKIEVDKFYHLPDTFMSEFLLFASPIAKAIEKSFPCKRCGASIIGLEVPHTHLHLIPINTMDDMNFNREKLKLSSIEFEQAQEKIITNLKNILK